MSIKRAYENFLKQEVKYQRKEKDKMSASTSTGLLAPRRGNKMDKTEAKADQFQSVYNAVKAIRNRKI